jgi:hypothetical protein
MKPFGRSRARFGVVLIGVLALVALAVAWTASAAAPTGAKPVQKAATITLPTNPPGPEDHALFTHGHAMVAGQCAGDGTTTMTKVTITAVGGNIVITSGGWPAETLYANPDSNLGQRQKDAIIVVASDVDGGSSNHFAVFDGNGPSFSGTAGAWATAAGCVITAQVAG